MNDPRAMGCFSSKIADAAVTVALPAVTVTDGCIFAPQLLPNGAQIRISAGCWLGALPGGFSVAHVESSYVFAAFFEDCNRFTEASKICRETAPEVPPAPRAAPCCVTLVFGTASSGKSCNVI